VTPAVNKLGMYLTAEQFVEGTIFVPNFLSNIYWKVSLMSVSVPRNFDACHPVVLGYLVLFYYRLKTQYQ
jgi:hypothetical protein